MLTYQLRRLAFSVFFLLIIQSAFAQQTAAELNQVHDRMVLLMQQSATVELPQDIIAKVAEINQQEAQKTKISYGQLSLLKVIYNPALPKADILFFAREVLKNNASLFVAIHPLVKKKIRG
jgi:hypothetical protein